MDGHHHHPFQFSPILIGLLGIVAGAIMVATYHCIAVCSCCQRRAQNQINRRQNLPSNQQERPSSTSNSIRRLIPMVRYSKECNEGTCAVCLSDFKEGEAIRVLPECFHLFHVACIDTWLNSHANCPLCRANTTTPQHVALSLPHSGGVPPPEFHRIPEFGDDFSMMEG